jgi:hypothetical protein
MDSREESISCFPKTNFYTLSFLSFLQEKKPVVILKRHSLDFYGTGLSGTQGWTVVDMEIHHADSPSENNLLPDCRHCNQQVTSSFQLLWVFFSCPKLFYSTLHFS